MHVTPGNPRFGKAQIGNAIMAMDKVKDNGGNKKQQLAAGYAYLRQIDMPHHLPKACQGEFKEIKDDLDSPDHSKSGELNPNLTEDQAADIIERIRTLFAKLVEFLHSS
jgi:hypothetical protein